MNAKRLLFIAILLVATFFAGILFQRTFPLGLLILRLKASQSDGSEFTSASEVDIAKDTHWRQYWESPESETFVDRFFSGQADRIARSQNELASRRDAERTRASNPAVKAYARELVQAVAAGEISEAEKSLNREFTALSVDALRFGRGVGSPDILRDGIGGFHEQLKAAGIGLLVVPVPNPVDVVHPGHLGFDSYFSVQESYSDGLEELWKIGVEAIDLRYLLAQKPLAPGSLRLERFGHHWGSEGIELCVSHLTQNRLVDLPFTDFAGAQSSRIEVRFDPVTEEIAGNSRITKDELTPGTDWVRSVYFDGARMAYDPASPVVVLGDSMASYLNSTNTDGAVSGDFTAQLSAQLGLPLNVITKEGSGAEMPIHFARAVRDRGIAPQLVIWVFMYPVDFGEWRRFDLSDVELSNRPDLSQLKTGISQSTEPVIEKPAHSRVRIIRTSTLPDPKQSPYPDALTVCEVELLSPSPANELNIGDRIQLVSWAFADRELEAGGRLSIDSEIEVDLQSWEAAQTADPRLETLRLIDDIEDFVMPQYWARGM